MLSPRLLFLIAICGATGAVTRYLVSQFAIRWFGDELPLGTLIVNVSGCFLIGMLSQATHATEFISGPWRVAIGVGFLGGLTTFSTFGFETFRHLEDGDWSIAIGSIGANLLCGLAAVWIGVQFGRLLVGTA